MFAGDFSAPPAPCKPRARLYEARQWIAFTYAVAMS